MLSNLCTVYVFQDKYGNHVTKGMNGQVVIEIESATPDDKDLPVIAGSSKQKPSTATLAGGSCVIQVCVKIIMYGIS